MSSMDDESKVKTFFKNHWGKMIYAGVLVVILIITFIGMSHEQMEDQFILDRLTTENADPLYFKYTRHGSR